MEEFENNKYLIIPTYLTGSVNLSEINEDSLEDLFISPDSQHCIISYPSGGRPSIYSTAYFEYDYSGVLEYTTQNEW